MRAPAFTDAVRCVLVEAGWTPDRLVDTSEARAAHSARGLSLHPAAEAFVRSFGGLTLPSRRTASALSLSCVPALARISDAALAAKEAWLGESFALLGATEDGDKLLLMSARGALYLANEHVLVCYGTDVEELFTRLFAAPVQRGRDWN